MSLLTFCRDSRVSCSSHDEPECFLDPDNPIEILRYLGSAVKFEEGLTTAGLFRCLRPWKEVVGQMGRLDFEAWDRKVAVSHLRDLSAVEVKVEQEVQLVEIVIYPRVGLRDWNLNLVWETHGLTQPDSSGKVDTYAFDYSPLEEWISLPIRIEDTCEPTVETRHSRRKWETSHLPPTRICPTFYDTVVLGFLDDISMSGSPDETAEVRSWVIGLKDEILSGMETPAPEDRNI